VRHRAGGRDAFQSPVNRENLDDAYDNWETASAVPLSYDDYLLVGLLVDDYTRQFSFQFHFSTTF
jgi:hypothetical protein